MPIRLRLLFWFHDFCWGIRQFANKRSWRNWVDEDDPTGFYVWLYSVCEKGRYWAQFKIVKRGYNVYRERLP